MNPIRMLHRISIKNLGLCLIGLALFFSGVQLAYFGFNLWPGSGPEWFCEVFNFLVAGVGVALFQRPVEVWHLGRLDTSSHDPFPGGLGEPELDEEER